MSSGSPRCVTSLSLRPSLISSLQAAGFDAVEDILEYSPHQLSRELQISMEDALEIFSYAQETESSCTGVFTKNGIQMLQSLPAFSKASNTTVSSELSSQHNSMNTPIITFCRSVDMMIGGGIQSGQVTEFCGVPGIGKTQLAMQLALDVQIPPIFRGCGGEAVYIDTEGSLHISRLRQMAEAVVDHLRQIASTALSRAVESLQACQSGIAAENSDELYQRKSLADKKVAEAESLSVDSLLSGIHVYRAHDLTEFLAVIAQLGSYLNFHAKIKLVVIDSVAFPFRQAEGGFQKSRSLSNLSKNLYQIAFQKNVAVVVLNHVTTKVNRAASNTSDPATTTTTTNEGSTQVVPALGDHWSHCVTNRIMMHWEKTMDGCIERVARLTKSPSCPCSRATFAVLSKGVRDAATSKSRSLSPRTSNGENMKSNNDEQNKETILSSDHTDTKRQKIR